MWKVSLRGLLAHKARLVLTVLAVTLGVMFLTSTYVLTDSANRGFRELFTTVNAGVDLQVRTPSLEDTGHAFGGGGTVPASLLAPIRTVEGVAFAEGLIFRPGVAIVGADGEVVESLGRPSFVTNSVDHLDLTPYRIAAGRAPGAIGEVLLDSNSIRDGDLAIGGPVDLIFPTDAGRQTFTLVGELSFGDSEEFAAAQVAMLDLADVQAAFAAGDVYDFIAISVEPTAAVRDVRRSVEAVLPPGVEVRTGAEVTDEQVSQLGGIISIFGTVLRAFGFVGMFVAAFTIVNTFTIIVSQRVRELALLRALGASPRQVVGAVFLEALVVGLGASALGLGLGYLLGALLKWLVAQIGFDPGGVGAVLEVRTIVVAVSIGTGVTLLAAVFPALRAARTQPLAAVRHVEAAATVTGPIRTVFGASLLGGGAIALRYGTLAGTSTGFIAAGAGALAFILGAVLLAPHLAQPAARVLGAPLARLGGVTGNLARANVARNPRRTAITASALMIGLAIVTAFLVLTASVIRSIDVLIDRSIAADLTISTPVGGFSTAVREALREVPEVGSATSVRYSREAARIAGRGATVDAIEPDAVDGLMRLRVADFDRDGFASGGVLVARTKADDEAWQVGDVIPATFATVGDRPLVIAGIFEERGFFDEYVVAIDTYEELFTDQRDFFVFAGAAAGVGIEELRVAVEATIGETYPNVDVKDREQLKAQQRQQAMLFLAVFVAMLALTLLISILGILNTLALALVERTREIGLLRAVGTQRRQIGWIVVWEAVIVAVLGGVLGVGIGLVFGTALTRAVQDFQITELVIPWLGLLGVVVVAAGAGFVAALYPAWRASRLDLLQAVAAD